MHSGSSLLPRGRGCLVQLGPVGNSSARSRPNPRRTTALVSTLDWRLHHPMERTVHLQGSPVSYYPWSPRSRGAFRGQPLAGSSLDGCTAQLSCGFSFALVSYSDLRSLVV